jgi:hypothetical protein
MENSSIDGKHEAYYIVYPSRNAPVLLYLCLHSFSYSLPSKEKVTHYLKPPHDPIYQSMYHH